MELDRPGLHYEPLLDMELQVYTRHDHPILSTPQPLAENLVGYPWIGFSSDDQLDDNVRRWAETVGCKMRQFSLRVMSLSSMMAVARVSDHIIFAVDALDDELSQNGLVRFPFAHKLGRVRSGLAMRSSIAALPPIVDLVRRTRECCHEA